MCSQSNEVQPEKTVSQVGLSHKRNLNLVQIANHVSQTGSKQSANEQMNVNKSVNHTHTTAATDHEGIASELRV